MNENPGGTPVSAPDEASGGTPNPLNPTPLTPVQPETPETPEMMAQPEAKNTPEVASVTTETVAEVTEVTPAGESSTVESIGVQIGQPVAASATHIAMGAPRAARTPRPGRRVMQDVVRPNAAHATENEAGLAEGSAAGMADMHDATANIDDMAGVTGMAAGAAATPRLNTRRAGDSMPIPKDSIVEDKGSKKHGLLAALIILIVAVVIGAVVALLVFNPFGSKSDDSPVSLAIAKLLGDEAPTKLSLKGSLTVTSSDTSESVQMMRVAFDSGVNLKAKENFANATVALTMRDGGVFEFDVEEIYTADGDLYIRPSGLAEALKTYTTTYTESLETELGGDLIENCVSDLEAGSELLAETNCSYAAVTESLIGTMLAGLVDGLDNEWIRIPMGQTDDLLGMVDMDSSLLCLAESAGSLNGLGKIYTANPFITATDTQKKSGSDPLYQLGIDGAKWEKFNGAFQETAFAKSLQACIGDDYAITQGTALDQNTGLIAGIEEAYVAVDENHNVTQLMLTARDETTLTSLDVKIGYPKTVTIDEPNYYTDIEQLFMQMFGFGE